MGSRAFLLSLLTHMPGIMVHIFLEGRYIFLLVDDKR